MTALEALGIAFIGAVLGAGFGFFISIFWERKKDQREIKKIKQLLRDDFKRLCVIMDKRLALVEPCLESEKNIQSFVKELVSKKMDKKIVTKFYIPLEFNFWKAIEDSGSLIKLSLDEIKYVKNIHQFIDECAGELNSSYNTWENVLGDKSQHLNTSDDNDDVAVQKEITPATRAYFSDLSRRCQFMTGILNEGLERFDWIKPYQK